MKKVISVLVSFILIVWVGVSAAEKDLDIQGKKLISQKPPFMMMLPSEFRLIHSFSHENPERIRLPGPIFLSKPKVNRWKKCSFFR